ncbi:MAG: hypothetical protein WA996_11505 [Candidatus Promineifilaceae bacterium]
MADNIHAPLPSNTSEYGAWFQNHAPLVVDQGSARGWSLVIGRWVAGRWLSKAELGSTALSMVVSRSSLVVGRWSAQLS